MPTVASSSSSRPTATSALAGHMGRAGADALSARQAALEGDLAGKVHVLGSDPKNGLAAALARLGVHGAKRLIFPEVHKMRRNLPQS